MASSFYEPDDVYWGTLAGLLEGVDAGVTTIVDHPYMQYSPEHGMFDLLLTMRPLKLISQSSQERNRCPCRLRHPIHIRLLSYLGSKILGTDFDD
jgi:hypothetical protein